MCRLLCGHTLSIPLGKCQGARLLGCMEEYALFGKKPTKCLPKWPHHFAIPPAMNESSCCSTASPALMFSVLDSGHSNGCAVESDDCFNLYFPDDTWCGASFHRLTYLLHLFFSEMSAQVFDPFFNQVVFHCWSLSDCFLRSLLAIFASHLRDLKIIFLAICILNIQSTRHIPVSSLSDLYEELRVLVCLKRIEVVYCFNFWPIDALQNNKRSSLANGDLEKNCVFISEFSLSFTERLIISGFTTEARSV